MIIFNLQKLGNKVEIVLYENNLKMDYMFKNITILQLYKWLQIMKQYI